MVWLRTSCILSDRCGTTDERRSGCPAARLFKHVSRARAGCASRRRSRQIAALAVLLLSGWPTGEAARQPGGLFTAVSLDAVAVGASPIARDTLTLRRRLVTIDLGQLTPAATLGGAAGTDIAPRGVLTLNLFEDAVFTGLVERTAPTFSRVVSRYRAGWRASRWAR